MCVLCVFWASSITVISGEIFSLCHGGVLWFCTYQNIWGGFISYLDTVGTNTEYYFCSSDFAAFPWTTRSSAKCGQIVLLSENHVECNYK